MLWHLAGLFAPAAGLGAVAAGLAKLIWRRELSGRSWRRLWAHAAVPAALVTIAGLAIEGRDGRMSTYGAMVLAAAAGLWWASFMRRR
ncbi:MAG: hypothetical protein ACKVQR_08915 [Aquabacterium sp.]